MEKWGAHRLSEKHERVLQWTFFQIPLSFANEIETHTDTWILRDNILDSELSPRNVQPFAIYINHCMMSLQVDSGQTITHSLLSKLFFQLDKLTRGKIKKIHLTIQKRSKDSETFSVLGNPIWWWRHSLVRNLLLTPVQGVYFLHTPVHTKRRTTPYKISHQ